MTCEFQSKAIRDVRENIVVIYKMQLLGQFYPPSSDSTQNKPFFVAQVELCKLIPPGRKGGVNGNTSSPRSCGAIYCKDSIVNILSGDLFRTLYGRGGGGGPPRHLYVDPLAQSSRGTKRDYRSGGAGRDLCCRPAPPLSYCALATRSSRSRQNGVKRGQVALMVCTLQMHQKNHISRGCASSSLQISQIGSRSPIGWSKMLASSHQYDGNVRERRNTRVKNVLVDSPRIEPGNSRFEDTLNQPLSHRRSRALSGL
ncbi:hypothetical protein EVAR_86749_1 [Eumeta japonica]|uniref:Uncharacterized protein n=1 Tax=Eumeta variegata TaxID=151549 RepID=A0A4C1VZ28_EUMVA|nr:hypothetical protein EVAR_86749_1 [Eumeta japonica]